MNPTLKRLEEIEAYVYSHEEWKCDKHHKPENLKCEALWLCARLRDALRERDAAVDLLVPLHERMKRPSPARLAEAWEIVRRLFGEEESRG